MTKADEIIMDKAFIASNKYIKKEINREGAGLLVSYDEEIEKSEIKKSDTFSSSVWFEINIPNKDFLLHMEKSMKEQPKNVLDGLLSNESIAFLFNSESAEMHKNVNEYIQNNSVPENKRMAVYTDEMKYWYDKKRDFIMNIESGLDYMNFVIGRTIAKDIELAVAYINKFGACGSLYTDNKGERVIIYDPHTFTQLGKKHSERPIMSLSMN